jgi:hypothetical protein
LYHGKWKRSCRGHILIVPGGNDSLKISAIGLRESAPQALAFLTSILYVRNPRYHHKKVQLNGGLDGNGNKLVLRSWRFT